MLGSRGPRSNTLLDQVAPEGAPARHSLFECLCAHALAASEDCDVLQSRALSEGGAEGEASLNGDAGHLLPLPEPLFVFAFLACVLGRKPLRAPVSVAPPFCRQMCQRLQGKVVQVHLFAVVLAPTHVLTDVRRHLKAREPRHPRVCSRSRTNCHRVQLQALVNQFFTHLFTEMQVDE